LPLTVFTKRNFVADFLQAKCDFFTEIGRLAFLRPPSGDLGQRTVIILGSLESLIELSSLDVTAEALRAIIGSKSAILLQQWPVDPQFQVEGSPPPTILLPSKQG